MLFHQPDPSNAPAPSIGQQFELFLQNGGKVGEFALQTARTPNKIFAIQAHPIKESTAVAFLGGMLHLNTNSELAALVITKINTTRQILTGERQPAPIPEGDENPGIHYIGNN